MKTTFAEFSASLEITGWDDDTENLVHYEGGKGFSVDGKFVPMGLCYFDKLTNTVYVANEDGSLLANADYTHFDADEVHDFKLVSP